jgi:nucleoside-diphosphate-sugar epimerase
MKVFIVGATGYIGGTVAQRLLAEGHAVSGLARSEDSAGALVDRGIAPVRGTLGDLDILADAAGAADSVINAASADDPFAALALVAALRGTGKRLIHTSGSSVVADAAGGEHAGPVFSEDTPLDPHPARAGRVAIDRAILGSASHGVHAVVICPGLIYGEGRGAHRDSVQIPNLISAAKARGAGVHIGPGENIWSNVHIDDIADLFLRALDRAPAGTFYFAESGEQSMKDTAAAISRLLGFGGATVGLTRAEAIRLWGAGPALVSLASNSRVRADKARAMLGWTPSGVTLTDEIENGWYRRSLVR